MAVATTDGRVRLISTARPENGAFRRFTAPGRRPNLAVRIAFSPDGTHLLSGSSDKVAYIWQVRRHRTDVLALTYARDALPVQLSLSYRCRGRWTGRSRPRTCWRATRPNM